MPPLTDNQAVMAVLSCFALVLTINAICGVVGDLRIDDELGYLSPGTSAAELMRARGYLADTEYLVAADDYQLEIVRGRNPLFKRSALERGKLPIVFLHGIFQSSASWLMNSRYVEPRAYEQLASGMSSEQLYELVRRDPANRALPFLAMNFGYEVWLLSRRGFTAGSRRLVNRRNRTLIEALAEIPNTLFGNGFFPNANLPLTRPDRVTLLSLINVAHLNSTQLGQAQTTLDKLTSVLRMLKVSPLQIIQTLAKLPQDLNDIGDVNTLSKQFIDTFDREFWSFSMDEQAEFDFPATIGHVLRRTGANKLHMVGFSAGSAIALMGLSLRPELGDKISKLVLYAPAINLGSRMGADFALSYLDIPVQGYTGPVPFVFQARTIETLLQQICNNGVAQITLCETILETIVGFTAGQEPIREYVLATAPEPTSGRELMQVLQFARFERPRMYDFNTKAKNVAKYGQEEPPIYDLGRISLRNMSIYAGNRDGVVAPNAVATTVEQLSVPVELTLIGDKRVKFNHIGNQIHEHNNRLIILPTLIDIDRMNTLEMSLSA